MFTYQSPFKSSFYHEAFYVVLEINNKHASVSLLTLASSNMVQPLLTILFFSLVLTYFVSPSHMFSLSKLPYIYIFFICIFCLFRTQTCFTLCTMGRRKSKRKPPPKKKMTGDLDSQFTCPFCNHEKSCDVKMYVNFQQLSRDNLDVTFESLIYEVICFSPLFLVIVLSTGRGAETLG